MPGLTYDKFLIFGDSITEFSYNPYPYGTESQQSTVHFGYGAALQNIYTRRLDIVQRGYAGFNSDHAVEMIPEIIRIENSGEGGKIRIATVFFGTNDAVKEGSQHVPLERYLANMKSIVQLLQKNNINVILIGPAMHDEPRWRISREDDYRHGLIRSNENNEKYSDSLHELADSLDVPFVNLFKEFSKFDNWMGLLCDGVHFTGEGYKILYNKILKQIRKKYPELAPESLPFKLPYWRDIKPGIPLVEQ